MKNSFLLMLVALLLVSCNNTDKTEVYFIPTLHKRHNVNVNYSYDSLRSIVGRLHPDVIAVEIRPEDMGADSAYLAGMYPYEMRIMETWFPNARMEGFDWLGEEVEGRPIPDTYWETMELKKQEKALRQDSLYKSKVALCTQRFSERDSLIRNCSLQQLLNSNDTEIVRHYYTCLEQQLNNSPYSEIPAMSSRRDHKILENINRIIKENKGKRIVILTGDDHYVMLKDKLPHQPLYKN